jgi:PD-(D/E)XK nuclease superfamily protein
MRRSHSYSKRELLDSCLRRYFYEYYATAKKLPFDPARKPLVQGMKEFTGVYLLAGEKLHWFIEQFLKKGDSSRSWAERTSLAGFDLAVRYSRDPERNAVLRDSAYPPPMLLEYYYGDPNAEELASKARDALSGGMRRFLQDGPAKDLWTEITASEHYIEQKVGGLPKFDDFGVDGQIDLVGRSADRVRIVDWKLGLPGGSHDSLQLLIYGLWAQKKFQVDPTQVTARRVFLGDGTVEPEVFLDFGQMAVGKARMLQDIELMKELDSYGRSGMEEVFSACQRENVCRQCKYQGVCPDSRSGLVPKRTSASLMVLPSQV